LTTEPYAYCVYCGRLLKEFSDVRTTSCGQCRIVRSVKDELFGAEGSPPCPWCDSGRAVPIIYGYTSGQIPHLSAEEKAVWGGCCVSGSEPQWHCLDCGREWGRPHEEKFYYSSICGSACRTVPCSACIDRINEDAERILAEASKSAEEKARARKVRTLLLVLVLLVGTWDSMLGGEQTETILYPINRLKRFI
jgi:hypothetical protein